jgi:hypothetical protein
MPLLSASARPSLRTALLTLAAAAFLIVGCEGDFRPRAVGPEGQVTVVMDSTRWKGELGDAIRGNVGPYVETLPAPERMFDLVQFDLSDERTYDRIKEQKNIMFVAPLSDSTNEANFLRRRLSEEAREAVLDGQTAVVPKPNLWRRSQRVYFVTAATADGLVDALRREGDQVRSTFHEVTLERMEQEMFEKARQTALEDSLLNHHGFAVNVQHDYQIAVQNKTDSTGFVWMRRVLSDSRRELLVHYVEDADPSRITPEWVYQTRDSLTEAYVRGNVAGFTRIDYRRPLEAEEVTFLDRYGYETRGLWHMVARADSIDIDPTFDSRFVPMGGGGPFVNYTFYDRSSGRIYMIDGSVFAPGHDKLQFVRQMEVIANTFRTRSEASAPASGEAVAARQAE